MKSLVDPNPFLGRAEEATYAGADRSAATSKSRVSADPAPGKPPRRNGRFRVTSAFSLSVLLFVIAAAALHASLSDLRTGAQWATRSQMVLLRSRRVDAALLAAMSDQRLDHLASNDQADAALRHDLGTAQNEIAMLQPLVANDGGEKQEIARLDRLRIEALQRAQDNSSLPNRADVAGAQTEIDRALDAAIAQALSAVDDAEVERLHAEQDEMQRRTTFAIVLAGGTGILAFAAGGFGLVLVLGERSRDREAALRSELGHLARLNRLGHIASMLAHEVNQPLLATSAYICGAQRMLEQMPGESSERVDSALARAAAQVERASEIIRRLRRHVQQREPERIEAAVAQVFEEALSLSVPALDAVTVRQKIEPELPSVLVDRVQIVQVLVNLLRNAAEATEGCPRREIKLWATREDDHSIRIEVSDSGRGIAPEMRDRLFMPFSTTKAAGMGLGLSICRTLVEANGGRIGAKPSTKGGTVFHVTLPFAQHPTATASP
jgi:two-component system, LuxR family, sensor kinase FixL